MAENTARGTDMIDYSPFWERLKECHESWYSLINKHHISNSTLHRLKHNKDVSTKTLDTLCDILDCDICDIVTRRPTSPSGDQKTP